MPPRGGGEFGGVVVAVAGPVEPVGGKLVPLFAGDLARLATDADRGVGVETGGRLRRRSMTAPERPGEAIDERRQRCRRAGRSACGSSASSSSLMAMGEYLPPAGPRLACREWACGWAMSPMTPSAASVRPPCRPGSTWQANAFPSCMLTFCSATREVRSLALPPTDLAGVSPVERETDLVDQCGRRR